LVHRVRLKSSIGESGFAWLKASSEKDRRLNSKIVKSIEDILYFAQNRLPQEGKAFLLGLYHFISKKIPVPADRGISP